MLGREKASPILQKPIYHKKKNEKRKRKRSDPVLWQYIPSENESFDFTTIVDRLGWSVGHNLDVLKINKQIRRIVSSFYQLWPWIELKVTVIHSMPHIGDNNEKQNRESTDGCSKCIVRQITTSSGKGLVSTSITYASSKWEGTRCPEEKASHVDLAWHKHHAC